MPAIKDYPPEVLAVLIAQHPELADELTPVVKAKEKAKPAEVLNLERQLARTRAAAGLAEARARQQWVRQSITAIDRESALRIQLLKRRPVLSSQQPRQKRSAPGATTTLAVIVLAVFAAVWLGLWWITPAVVCAWCVGESVWRRS